MPQSSWGYMSGAHVPFTAYVCDTIIVSFHLQNHSLIAVERNFSLCERRIGGIGQDYLFDTSGKRQLLRFILVVGHDQKGLILGLSVICHDIMHILKIRSKVSVNERFRIFFALSQADQRPVIVKYRVSIVFLIRQIDFSVIRIYAEPRRSRCEACIFRGIPLERRPCVVAPVFFDHMKRVRV